MANLKGFLIDLALNPNLMQQYAKDPQATIAGAGLTEADQAAVLAGDAAQLRIALGRPDNDCMSQTGSKLREAESGRSLRLTEWLPLEKTVTLPMAVEMEIGGKFKKFAAGSKVTRHKKARRKPGSRKKQGRTR